MFNTNQLWTMYFRLTTEHNELDMRLMFIDALRQTLEDIHVDNGRKLETLVDGVEYDDLAKEAGYILNDQGAMEVEKARIWDELERRGVN